MMTLCNGDLVLRWINGAPNKPWTIVGFSDNDDVIRALFHDFVGNGYKVSDFVVFVDVNT